jgi:hypothetical protein
MLLLVFCFCAQTFARLNHSTGFPENEGARNDDSCGGAAGARPFCWHLSKRSIELIGARRATAL